MSIILNAPVQGKNDVPSVSGSPVGLKGYATVDLPDPALLDAGTLVYDLTLSVVKQTNGVAWSAVGTPLGSATPAAVGTATAGTAIDASHEDHVHAHGNQLGESLHAVATDSVAGFQSAADKTTFDVLAAVGNVKLYGAIGNGTTDDTSAIAAAIAANSAIYFPAGNYKVTTTLSVGEKKIIFGDGKGSKITYTGSGSIFSVAPAITSDQTESAFANLWIFSSSATCTAGVTLANCYRVTFNNVSLDGSSGNGMTTAGLNITSTSGHNNSVVIYQNGEIVGTGGAGVKASNPIGDAGIYIRGNHIHACTGYGVYVPVGGSPNSPTEIHVDDNVIEGNTAGAVYGDSLCGSTIDNNHLENSAGVSVALVRLGAAGAFVGVSVSGNTFSGATASYLIDATCIGASYGLVVRGNYWTGASVAAVKIQTVNNAVIAGNSNLGTIPALLATVGILNTSYVVQDDTSLAYVGSQTFTGPVINGATSASGNFDLSGSSGTFKTTTGASTFGGSSNTFTNAITASSVVAPTSTALTLTGKAASTWSLLAAANNVAGSALTVSSGAGAAAGSGNAGTVGGALALTAGAGGASDGTSASAVGGAITATSGAGGAANTAVAASNGGAVTLTAGAGGAGSASGAAGTGGAASLVAGAAGANGGGGNGTAGAVTVQAGAGSAGNGSTGGGSGGSAVLQGGSGGAGTSSSSSGAGGTCFVKGGNAAGTSTGGSTPGVGGTLTCIGGSGAPAVTSTLASAGGSATFTGGTGGGSSSLAAAGAGGLVTIQGGSPGSNSNGGGSAASGGVTIQSQTGNAGDASHAPGAAGAIQILGGSPGAATSNGTGGTVGAALTFTAGVGSAGNGTATAGAGGPMTIKTGAGGAGTASVAGVAGGLLTMQGGAGGASGGTTAGTGGGLTLTSGTGGASSGSAAGGAGGNTTISGGIGGVGNATPGTPGAGGIVTIAGGAAGGDGSSGANANGGAVNIDGGAKVNSGTDGAINIGVTRGAVTIKAPTLTGTVTFSSTPLFSGTIGGTATFTTLAAQTFSCNSSTPAASLTVGGYNGSGTGGSIVVTGNNEAGKVVVTTTNSGVGAGTSWFTLTLANSVAAANGIAVELLAGDAATSAQFFDQFNSNNHHWVSSTTTTWTLNMSNGAGFGAQNTAYTFIYIARIY